MYKRLFSPLSQKKSFFFLGPRQTGKSTLLHEYVPDVQYFDLLDPALFAEFSARPELLIAHLQGLQNSSRRKDNLKYIVIDEIQKMPKLLDAVQFILGKEKDLAFILTGSSARKLRKAGQNLLGGRARMVSFCPLTLRELSQVDKDPISKAIMYGGLPGVRTSTQPTSELRDYVGVYLNEEIMAEALVRNLGNFSRFLRTASLCSGEQLNYQKIGNDAQVSGNTVRDYFDILEDTLIADRIYPFKPVESRKFVSTPKFYFFDVGVCHFITKKSTSDLGPTEIGKALENLIYCELKAFRSYIRPDYEIFYWRTQTGHEVDFVLRDSKGEIIAIEIKATKTPSEPDLKGLRALSNEIPIKRKILVCRVARARRTDDNCEILPVMKFVDQLWNEEI